MKIMQFIIDSADTKAIRHCMEFFPVAGVTTNPTIISKEKSDFKQLIAEIRSIIGPDKMLHVQCTSDTADEIVGEAKALKAIAGGDFYVKIPVSAEGLKAIRILKGQGIKVTATAIFTQQQALLAALAGADYVAPYINRLDNIVSDGAHVVEEIVTLFKTHNISTKVLAASFKNVEQVHKVSMVGCPAVTINPELFDQLIYHPLTLYAVDAFTADWEMVYGEKKILELLQ